MKKALIAAPILVLSFGLGIVGMYIAMPTIAPDVVEEARQRTDSLATAQEDSVSSQDSRELAGAALPVSVAADAGDSDTISVTPPADSLPRAAIADTLSQIVRRQQTVISELEDSLATLHAELEAGAETSASLRQDVEALRAQLDERERRRAQAEDLSQRLARIEDRELEAIMKQLDTKTLEHLYREATGRNRTRLLQAMPADRAARFVNRLVSNATASDAPDEPTPTN